MGSALEWRRRIFMGAGFAMIVVLGLAQAVSGLISDKGDPDILTAGLWAFSAVELVTLSTILLGPRQGVRIRAGAGEVGGQGEVGKTLSFLAVALAASPMLFGVVMWLISGDVWRLYAFVPLSLAAGAVYWARVGSLLTTLEAQVGPESGPEIAS
jgi:hypothetical protein